jgi:polyphosphate kinase
MIDVFEQEINAQIKRKKKNLPAGIKIKLNNLEDIPMIDLLLKAGEAGVPVQLIVRSICCLKTGELPGSENIKVKRIVDRFLEHSRIFIFGEDEKANVYIGSSDWMTRNLHHRIEVCVPIKDEPLVSELKEYFNIQWDDNTKADWVENATNEMNEPLKPEGTRCSQQEIYAYLKNRR